MERRRMKSFDVSLAESETVASDFIGDTYPVKSERLCDLASSDIPDADHKWTVDTTSPQAAARSLDTLIGTAKYRHFDSIDEERRNREYVDDYDSKKSTAELAMLKTQRETLTSHCEYFDQASLERFCRDFDSNKLEIYDSLLFESKFLNHTDLPPGAKERVTGLHRLRDGAICIRNTDDMQRLKKTTVHETFHDLSYHGETIDQVEIPDNRGETHPFELKRSKAGLHEVRFWKSKDARLEMEHHEEIGRALNEGVTETLALEEMVRRGEHADVLSYTLEVGWARQIMQKMGRENVERAYFRGDDSRLRDHAAVRTGDSAFWERLLQAMDKRHNARSLEERNKQEVIVSKMIDKL